MTFNVNLNLVRNRKPPHKVFHYKYANWDKLKDHMAVLLLVICCLLQLVLGRLKSPAITTFGVFFCSIWFCQRLVQGFNGLEMVIVGLVEGGKVNGFISCKLIFFHTISQFVRLISGSATMSFQKAMRTSPPWVFLSFRMAL